MAPSFPPSSFLEVGGGGGGGGDLHRFQRPTLLWREEKNKEQQNDATGHTSNGAPGYQCPMKTEVRTSADLLALGAGFSVVFASIPDGGIVLSIFFFFL